MKAPKPESTPASLPNCGMHAGRPARAWQDASAPGRGETWRNNTLSRWFFEDDAHTTGRGRQSAGGGRQGVRTPRSQSQVEAEGIDRAAYCPLTVNDDRDGNDGGRGLGGGNNAVSQRFRLLSSSATVKSIFLCWQMGKLPLNYNATLRCCHGFETAIKIIAEGKSS